MIAYYEARAAECRRAAKRNRIVGTVLIVLAVAFGILGFFAMVTGGFGMSILLSAAVIAGDGFILRHLARSMDETALRWDHLARRAVTL